MPKLASLTVLASLLLCAAGARADDDPSDVPAAPAGELPPAAAADAPVPAPSDGAATAPTDEAAAPDAARDAAHDALPAPSPRVDDPLARCRALMLDGDLDQAQRCVHAVLTDAGAAPEVRWRARALGDVLAAWGRQVQAPASEQQAPMQEPVPAKVKEQVKVSALVDAIGAEAMVHGALGGAGAGFLVAATVASATRDSEADTLPWLIAAPAVGGLAGAAGGWGLARALDPAIGDLRLATSTMWMGATQGFLLQWIVFDQSPDVGATPLRFVTMLGGGMLGLGAGAALAPLVDIDDGDVAVAHSAALWGGVLTTITLVGVSDYVRTPSQVATLAVVAGGIGVPYLAALACHPFIDLERWPTFLIEGGGAAGLLISGAFLAATTGSLQTNQALLGAVLGVGTAAGLAVGATAAVMVSSAVQHEARARAGRDEGVE